MLQYILAGLALGSIYAIASSAIVVTFVSTGVLNFAFGAIAYFIARFYYWLNTQHGMTSYSAAGISLLLVAPAFGVFLYFALFRFVRGKSTLVKLVVTIGLWVALQAFTDVVFGIQNITAAPGLASPADKPFHFLGAPVTTDQVIIYAFLIFILVGGTTVLRFTDVGLRVRAMVDSEAMTNISGTSPGRVSVGVWAVATMLTGLAGILVAPSQGLNIGGMSTLMAAAFAAVVAARLRSLPGAIAASLAMGVVTDVIQKYLPANSSFTAAIIPSIPFAFILIFLIFYVVRSGSVDDEAAEGGPLDQAIKPANDDPVVISEAAATGARWEVALGAIPLLAVAALPLIFSGSSYWLGVTATGLCYAIIFLNFTVVTGEGGMLWLSQIIFAGAGALATAQFASVWHVPVLLAAVCGGVIAAVVGAVIGVLTLRLGDIYVGLVTFSFGLLVEDLVFTRNRFLQGGVGVIVTPPKFATGTLAFCFLALAVFLILAGLTWNLRRSTSGLALRAVRDSEPASRMLGISVVQVKVIVGALAAFVAAVGGAFFAMNQGVAQPASYPTFQGLVWLAVVVTMGIRSINAAALAGMSFSLIPALFATYVPARWGEIPTMLFGLGAIGVARHPEGVILQNGRDIRRLLAKLVARLQQPQADVEPESKVAALGGAEGAIAAVGAAPGGTRAQTKATP
jgi:branched-chain amino acid transport system permease protein